MQSLSIAGFGMSAEKITELEKKVAVMENSIPPLIEEMKNSTRAQIELTAELKQTNEIARELKEAVKTHDRRIYDLEAQEGIRQSKDKVVDWIKRSVVVAIVGSIMVLIMK